MNILWSMIWTHSNAAAVKSKKARDAFADPLERVEWQGLDWATTLIAKLVSGPRPVRAQKQKMQQVERFTASAPGKSVCVS